MVVKRRRHSNGGTKLVADRTTNFCFGLRRRNNELTNFLRQKTGRSTVAHFARKVRGADIVADKH